MKNKALRFLKKALPFMVFTAIALAVGALAGFFTHGSMEEFEALAKPPLSPPGWVFGVVWSVLYVLMGISAALVWRAHGSDERTGALVLWGIQLPVNFFWPIFFFAFEYRLLAFIWLLLLAVLVAVMIARMYRVRSAAAYIQLPYLAWLLFALYLNMGVYLLNK